MIGRSLGAFNLLKTELAMIGRSQVDPNHRLLFANAFIGSYSGQRIVSCSTSSVDGR